MMTTRVNSVRAGDERMTLTKTLKLLVFGLPVFIIGFAIFMGGYAVTQAMADRVGAAIYWHLSLGCLLFLALDVVLLVGLLGMRAIADADDDEGPGTENR